MGTATLQDLGEIEAIRRLARRLHGRPDVRVGIGDDAAVVRVPGSDSDWALTSDPVIEGTHFRPGERGRRVGHKAVGRVLSDLAAMGAQPDWILIDVVARDGTPWPWMDEVYRGAEALARRHGAAIVGGDLARGPAVELHVFGVGRVPRGRACRRRGARPGDRLYVTGALGGSAAGRHLDFEPRVREGRFLRRGRWVTAMMDVSDGLSTDLRRLLAESGVGADVRAASVPASRPARSCRDGRSPLDHALCDGEDFELLFTVPRRKAAAFERAWRRAFRLRCTGIGEITRDSGFLRLLDADGRPQRWPGRGYEHFISAPRPPLPAAGGRRR